MQQVRAIETRSIIIAEAAASFRLHGYGGSSIAAIAAAAGLTKGAVYFHFESKEALAHAVITAQHERSIALSESVAARKATGVRAVVMLAFAMARQLRDDPIVRAGIRLTMEASSFGASVERPYLEWSAAIEAPLVQARQSGELRDTVDVPALARFINSSFTGVQLVSDVLTDHVDLYQRIEEMWDIILPSVVATERWVDFRSVATDVRRELTQD